MMNGRLTKILLLIITAMLLVQNSAWAQTQAEQSREYQIKAAFIYNFIKFISWPPKTEESEKEAQKATKAETADKKTELVMGIVGENPFGKSFEPVIAKEENKKLVIESFPSLDMSKIKGSEKTAYLKGYADKYQKAMKNCLILFISSKEKDAIEEILKMVNTSPVLTISEMDGFIEKGGMVNFVTEESKVRFEINESAAKKGGLQISSKLLSLAKKVIMEKDIKKSGSLVDGFDDGVQIAQLVKYMPGN